MIVFLLVIGGAALALLLIFALGAFRLAGLADDDFAGLQLSRLRNDNVKHHLRDEHAEGWAVGGGVHFHRSTD